MPFSFHYGLSLMCLTMLVTQVCPQCNQTNEGSLKYAEGPYPPCCMTANNATINEPVNDCFVHYEHTFPHCPIHAYILRTKNDDRCVDPTAWWLQQRLQRLEARGICCRIF
ncbi:C-C motif chemokine 34b.8 isoform X3 [Sander lucioperca]|uniref:C-C motif chemokine 34b.8 isoform X3 n=1 Tax=Sander lucioperca TaxID=283035 RepID=UPI001653B9C9|nr:C-C motif chemokine 34b.8 isoform X3 [Sander lucioperca]